MERVDRHDLRRCFVSVQTADGNPGKPHPGMLHRALSEAGIPASGAVMIGDTSFDMMMGVNAGTGTLGVSWGYHPPEELIAAGAAALVATPNEIAKALDRMLRPVVSGADASARG